MRMLSAFVLVMCASHARAEFVFDLRETVTGHPSLVLKSTETNSRIFIRGGKIAKLQNQIVQIVDDENNLLSLVDYRDKKFATSTLSEAQRRRDLWFDQRFPGDIRIEAIASQQPAEWDGRATKRDVYRIKINNAPGPGEWLYTVDWSTGPPPDFEQTSRAIAATDERYDQELDAEIQTLVFMNRDRFKDLQKVRKGQSKKAGLVIHSVAELRLKKGAPLLDTIGQELADQPLITKELEVVNFNVSPVDFNIFFVPSGFEQVEMNELLAQQDIRANP
jgi:hypothetical protein